MLSISLQGILMESIGDTAQQAFASHIHMELGILLISNNTITIIISISITSIEVPARPFLFKAKLLELSRVALLTLFHLPSTASTLPNSPVFWLQIVSISILVTVSVVVQTFHQMFVCPFCTQM